MKNPDNKMKITNKHMKIASLLAVIGCFLELTATKDNLYPEIVIEILSPLGYILLLFYFVFSFRYFKEKCNEEDKDSI